MTMNRLARLAQTLTAGLTVVVAGMGAAPAGPVPSGRENLVANGSFRARDPEGRPLRWVTGRGLQTAAIITKEHHGAEPDDSCLALSDGSASDAVTVRSEKRIAAPGCVYIARAWTKAGSGTPAVLSLEFWDQNAARIGSASAGPATGSGWQEVEVSLAAPDTVTHVSVALATGKPTTGVSYWDDVSLRPVIAYDGKVRPGVRELFLDDYRVEAMVDLQRVVHPGRKTRPLLVPTEPWERHSVYIYGTVLKDEPAGSGYRMWYTAYSEGDYYLCYATSVDGIAWQKPKLGLFDFKGNKENNITRVGGGTLVYDPDDADAARRYKLMANNVKGGKQGYSVFFSPDGLTWTAFPGNPVLPYGDVSAVTYDRTARLFIASTKQRMLVSNTSVTPAKMDRAAFVSVSRNFTEWSAPAAPQSAWTLAVEGEPADDLVVQAAGGIEAQIYGMPIFPYEHVYIGMPWVFSIMTYSSGIYAKTGDGPIQPQLAMSRDLRHWARPAREPVLPLGEAGRWDDGTLYTASTLLVSADRMELYFGAMNLGHGGSTPTQTQTARIARATWRRDGFMSLRNGGDDPGTVTTKSLVLEGGTQLRVNAVLHAQGSLKIELLDPAGTPLPGFSLAEAMPITGDQLAAEVRWNSGARLASVTGREVKLRFVLTGGDLYSYWVE
jgi:hypothetical protein